jgi:O-antigen/teichoic acid export membrane protein
VTADPVFARIKSVARHSAIYGLFDFLGKASALVLVPLYAKLLGPAEYGRLELLVVTHALLLIALILGFSSSLTRFYLLSGDPAARRAYFHTTVTVVSVTAGAITAALFIAAPVFSGLVAGTGDGYWRLVFVTGYLDAMALVFLSLFRAQEKSFRYSAINLGKLLTALVANVILVGFLRWGVFGVLVGNLAGAAMGCGVGLWLARRELGFGVDIARLRELAGFGLPLVLSGVAMFAMNSADRYFLRAYSDVAELGTYAMGYKVAMIIAVMVKAFTVAWPPAAFRIVHDPDAKTTYAKILTYYLAVTMTLVLGVTSFRTEVVAILSTPEYAAATSVVLLLMLSIVLQGVYYIFQINVSLTNRTYLVPPVVFLAVGVNTLLNFLLIPRYGMQGAAVATITAFFTLAAATLLVGHRFYPIRYEWRNMAMIALCAAAVVLVNDCVTAVLGSRTWASAGIRLGVLALFPVGLVAVRVFSADEVRRGVRMTRRVLRGRRR